MKTLFNVAKASQSFISKMTSRAIKRDNFFLPWSRINSTICRQIKRRTECMQKHYAKSYLVHTPKTDGFILIRKIYSMVSSSVFSKQKYSFIKYTITKGISKKCVSYQNYFYFTLLHCKFSLYFIKHCFWCSIVLAFYHEVMRSTSCNVHIWEADQTTVQNFKQLKINWKQHHHHMFQCNCHDHSPFVIFCWNISPHSHKRISFHNYEQLPDSYFHLTQVGVGTPSQQHFIS